MKKSKAQKPLIHCYITSSADFLDIIKRALKKFTVTKKHDLTLIEHTTQALNGIILHSSCFGISYQTILQEVNKSVKKLLKLNPEMKVVYIARAGKFLEAKVIHSNTVFVASEHIASLLPGIFGKITKVAIFAKDAPFWQKLEDTFKLYGIEVEIFGYDEIENNVSTQHSVVIISKNDQKVPSEPIELIEKQNPTAKTAFASSIMATSGSTQFNDLFLKTSMTPYEIVTAIIQLSMGQ